MMNITNIGRPIPITCVATFPCPNGLYTAKKKEQIVCRYMGLTDRIKNVNKVKTIARIHVRHIFDGISVPPFPPSAFCSSYTMFGTFWRLSSFLNFFLLASSLCTQ